LYFVSHLEKPLVRPTTHPPHSTEGSDVPRSKHMTHFTDASHPTETHHSTEKPYTTVTGTTAPSPSHAEAGKGLLTIIDHIFC